MAEAAPAHLRERDAARRDERPERERGLVADAAGRVLVDDLAPERATRSIVSPLATIASVSASVSRGGEPAEEDGHAERGHLVVGHLLARVAEHELGDLVAGRAPRRRACARSAPRARITALARSAGRESRRGGAFPPSQASTVAPTSANSPPRGSGRRRCGPATYASRSAYSREWSVDGVVGSQPWSEVRTSRSSVAQRVEQVGQPPVEVLEAAVEVLRVVPVAPEHVGLDEVHEDEALVDSPEQLLGLRGCPRRSTSSGATRRCPRRRRCRGSCRRRDRRAGVAQERQVVRPRRLEREVVPVRRARVVARLADERPRDHAADGVLAR